MCPNTQYLSFNEWLPLSLTNYLKLCLIFLEEMQINHNLFSFNLKNILFTFCSKEIFPTVAMKTISDN